MQGNIEKLYTVSKTRLGADCGSDHELIAKFRLKLKKVGKTTRPFRHDLNETPYDDFPGGSDSEACACSSGDPGSIPGLGRSSGKEMATHSSTLAWKIPLTEESGTL